MGLLMSLMSSLSFRTTWNSQMNVNVDHHAIFPTPGLAARWEEILFEIQTESSSVTRGRLSLQGKEWLQGLADGALLRPSQHRFLLDRLSAARHNQILLSDRSN